MMTTATNSTKRKTSAPKLVPWSARHERFAVGRCLEIAGELILTETTPRAADIMMWCHSFGVLDEATVRYEMARAGFTDIRIDKEIALIRMRAEHVTAKDPTS